MVLGLVSGSRIRSSRVETDSTCFERRLSGLKSKLRPRSSGRPRTTAASVRPTTQLRCAIEKMVERRKPGPADRRRLAGRA